MADRTRINANAASAVIGNPSTWLRDIEEIKQRITVLEDIDFANASLFRHDIILNSASPSYKIHIILYDKQSTAFDAAGLCAWITTNYAASNRFICTGYFSGSATTAQPSGFRLSYSGTGVSKTMIAYFQNSSGTESNQTIGIYNTDTGVVSNLTVDAYSPVFVTGKEPEAD